MEPPSGVEDQEVTDPAGRPARPLEPLAGHLVRQRGQGVLDLGEPAEQAPGHRGGDLGRVDDRVGRRAGQGRARGGKVRPGVLRVQPGPVGHGRPGRAREEDRRHRAGDQSARPAGRRRGAVGVLLVAER